MTGKTLGEMTPAERRAVIGRTTSRLAAELEANAGEIGRIMDEAGAGPGPNGWVSARGGKWHRATRPEPTFTHDETTGCGLTFRPLNVTWHGERPPTTTDYICRRPGCKS